MSNIARLRNAACGIAAGAVLAAGLAALPALAQQAPPQPGDGAPFHGHREMRPPFLRACADLDAHEAAALAFAQVKLGITDAQKSAWADFSGKVTASAAPIHELCKSLDGKPWPKTLPEHLALVEQIASAHAARLHALRPAVDQLYAQLTPEQKQTADHLLDRLGESGDAGPGHRGGFMMGPPGGPHRFGPGAPPPAPPPQ